MYAYNKLTTCGGINLTLSWKRQGNRGTRREIDHTPKKAESTDEKGGKQEGSALCTRHQLMLLI